MALAITDNVVDLTQDDSDLDPVQTGIDSKRPPLTSAHELQRSDHLSAYAPGRLDTTAQQPRGRSVAQRQQVMLAQPHMQMQMPKQASAHLQRTPHLSNPAPSLPDPALHTLDSMFMRDVLSVLIYNRPTDQLQRPPTFASLQVDAMQLLTPAQALDQGRTLVFLEWLTVKICQHGLLNEHESLTRYVLSKCKAAQVSLSYMCVCLPTSKTPSFAQATAALCTQPSAVASLHWKPLLEAHVWNNQQSCANPLLDFFGAPLP